MEQASGWWPVRPKLRLTSFRLFKSVSKVKLWLLKSANSGSENGRDIYQESPETESVHEENPIEEPTQLKSQHEENPIE